MGFFSRMMAGAGQGAAEVGKQMYQHAGASELEQMRQEAQAARDQRLQEFQSNLTDRKISADKELHASDNETKKEVARIGADYKSKRGIGAIEAKLGELADMLDNGDLTPEQYNDAKLRIIGGAQKPENRYADVNAARGVYNSQFTSMMGGRKPDAPDFEVWYRNNWPKIRDLTRGNVQGGGSGSPSPTPSPSKFTSPDQVRDAYRSGAITRDDAMNALGQFGYK